MTVSDREKRLLIVWAVVMVLGLIYWLASSPARSTAKISAPVDSIDRSERRLAALRASLASVNGKETVLHQVQSELSDRERGLIPGDTPEQAQAQLLQIARRVARAQAPPLDVRQSELGQPRAYGDAYGEVAVSVTIDCRIDELINFLASLSQQPEIIATEDIHLNNPNAKSKVLTARVTISGLVPRKLVPEKKALLGVQL